MNTNTKFTIRDPKPGDMGWVIQAHGAFYFHEYQWDSRFEALVADIVAKMMKHHDPEWERGWIVEKDSHPVASVFVIRKSRTVAQLRLLLVTPEARGLGLGALLTDECLKFARSKGYRKMVLWTHENLTAARAIYARRGFRLIKSEPYEGFGQRIVGENWALKL